MATTRCIRCGNPMLGVAQFCEDCVGEKRAEEEARAQRAAEVAAQRSAASATAVGTSSRICPSCGNSVNPGANFCAWCRTQLRDDVALAHRKVEYAGFWIRLLAQLIDSTIMGFIASIIVFGVKDLFTALFLLSFLGPAYILGFWITQGATPGKMALGLRITTDDRDPLGPIGAIIRYVGYSVCGLTLGFGYLMIAFTAEKRGLHDFIAGTMVIKTR